jgi:hypothetical protein
MPQPTDHDLDDDPELDPARTLARFRHPLAWLGWLVPLVPFLVFVGAAHRNDQQHLHENAAQLCAEAPACAGEEVEIAFASAPYLQRNRGIGTLVVYQRDPDCSRAVEAYYQAFGRLDFLGSPDDPDPLARARFLAEREEWATRYVVRERVPCSRSDEL